MAKQTIKVGDLPNDKTGDPLRTAFQKINDNFAELYGDDSSADTFTSPQITTPTITGTATIDNLIFNDSEIGTSSNANLNLNPGGTGTVELQAATNVTGALDVTGAATLDTSLTLATGATITEFATSTALGTSDTKVPTQNAVKAYVDAQNVAQAITFVGDDSTGTAVNSGEIFKIAGGIGLTSAVTGDALTLDIDATVTTLTGSQTLTNKILTTPTISSPSITGHATIEGVTPTGATGTGNLVFSADPTLTGTLTAAIISASGTLAAGNTTISGSLSSQDLTVTGNQTVTGNITAQGTIFSDKIKSPATNANLAISAQGTGVVDIQSAMTTMAQTITGNVSVPDGFITTLGNIEVYSNTISSTTSGDINIVANGAGQIVLNAARVAAGQINAATVALSNTLDTNTLRSYSSNADITIEPQGTGAIKLNSKLILAASQSDGSTTAIDLTKPVAILRGSDSGTGGDTAYTLGDGTTAGQIIYIVPGTGLNATMKVVVGKILWSGSIQTNFTFDPFYQGSPGGMVAMGIWNGSAWCFARHT